MTPTTAALLSASWSVVRDVWPRDERMGLDLFLAAHRVRELHAVGQRTPPTPENLAGAVAELQRCHDEARRR